MAFNFNWRKIRHEVDTEQGGLKMFDQVQFNKSLKILWIGKMQQTDPVPERLLFELEYGIDRLIWTNITMNAS